MKLISTQRLDLYCLTQTELFSMGNDRDLFAARSFSNPHGVISNENLPRTYPIKDVGENPDNIRWYYRMIINRESNVAVGSVSFHKAPDERGMLEIGIGIADAERGQGFAKEALLGMWNWAARQPGVKYLRYTVSPNNAPSLSIINKFGFPLVGEQVDEDGSQELIYETSVPDFFLLSQSIS